MVRSSRYIPLNLTKSQFLSYVKPSFLLHGLTVGPDDKVEIQGEVDTHMVKPTDIEVDIIRLVK